jgi:hypothetical protein
MSHPQPIIINTTEINDVKLCAYIAAELSTPNVDDSKNYVMAMLGVALVKRILEAGYTNNKLDYDCCFFMKGMPAVDISDWISDHLGLSYSGLKSLINCKEFDLVDTQATKLPTLDMHESLVLEIDCEDLDEIIIVDQILGDSPLSPFDGDTYHYGYIANTQIEKPVLISRTMAANVVDCEFYTVAPSN